MENSHSKVPSNSNSGVRETAATLDSLHGSKNLTTEFDFDWERFIDAKKTKNIIAFLDLARSVEVVTLEIK